MAALSLVRQCYAQWLEALQAYYKYCDAVTQQKIAFHARNATSAPTQNSAPVSAKVGAMDKLNRMIGLDSVKTAVRELVPMVAYEALRKEEGLPASDAGSLHLDLLGILVPERRLWQHLWPKFMRNMDC